MSIGKFFHVAYHNQMLGPARTNFLSKNARYDLKAASHGGTRLDVFCATVKSDMRCGQHYAAQVSRVPQAALGIGLAPTFSDAVLADLTDADNSESFHESAKYRPFAGVLNHLVSGVSLLGTAVVGAVSGLALGALAGVGFGVVGLGRNWRTAHQSALYGAKVGATAGFLGTGALGVLLTAGALNRVVAYGSGAITLAVRATGHVVGGALFGAAGVVHGAAAAMLHGSQKHDLPTPRAADEDFAFA